MTIDPATLEYRPCQKPRAAEPRRGEQDRRPARARAGEFISADDPAGRVRLGDLLAAPSLYSANRVPEICDDIAAIDDAMRWGYAWDLGPFELWDALGVTETVARMQADGRAIPEWVARLAASDEPVLLRGERRAGRDLRSGQTEHERAGAPAADRRARRSQGEPATTLDENASTPASSTSATAWPASSSTPRPTCQPKTVHQFIGEGDRARGRRVRRARHRQPGRRTSPAAPTSR